MSSAAVKKYTVAEYLALERTSETKHEYFAGEIYELSQPGQAFAMSGASFNHNVISGNLGRELGNQLKDTPCHVLPSDMRIRALTGLYTYPDVSIVCDRPTLEDDAGTLTNPIVICEILSPSTEGYDRGKKFQHYRSLSSLREYVLVSQDRVLVEHFARQPATGQWVLTTIDALDGFVEFPALGCRVALREIYAKVEFPAAVSVAPAS